MSAEKQHLKKKRLVRASEMPLSDNEDEGRVGGGIHAAASKSKRPPSILHDKSLDVDKENKGRSNVILGDDDAVFVDAVDPPRPKKQKNSSKSTISGSVSKSPSPDADRQGKKQASISQFFGMAAPIAPSSAVNTANSLSAPIPAQKKKKKTFSRSNKKLVTSVSRPPSTSQSGSRAEPVEFDDDDDFVVDEKVMKELDNVSSSLKRKAETEQKSPVKLSKSVESAAPPKTVSLSKNETVQKKKLSPPRSDSNKIDSPPKNDTEEKSDTKSKGRSAYHKFASRAGPVALGSKPLPVGKPNCLSGLTFVFTGELESTSREDAADLIKRYGGRVTSAPSGKTSYVVVGTEPGESKLKKAKSLGLKTLDEDSLFALIESQPGQEPQKPSIPIVKSIGVPTEGRKSGSSSSGVRKLSSKGAPVTRLPDPELSDMWTVRYAPHSLNEIIGNKGNIENLKKWLAEWRQNFHNDFKGSFRAALISGPPGIGKTTAAHLVARSVGFEVIEMNASDARSKSCLDDVVKELTGNHTIGEYFRTKFVQGDQKPQRSKNHCIVMDEVDGMGGGDRGGITELIQLIKKSKTPIVCICNDRNSMKVRSLANYCLDLRFHRPTATMMRTRISQIAQIEGIDIDVNAIDNLVTSTQSDIRQILNLLQTFKLSNNSMSYDESKALGQASKKNIDLGPFDLASRLFSGSVFRGLSIDDKLQLYFCDYQLLPAFTQENYIKMKPWKKPNSSNPAELDTLESIASAAVSISNSDLVEGMIYGRQAFGLMNVHAMMSTVIPATYVQGSMGDRLNFPSLLGQISKTNKSWRLLREIHMHMRLHVSSDKHEIRQTYMPVLLPRIAVPLMREKEAAIEKVIGFMEDYFLTKDDFDAMLELSLGPYNTASMTKKLDGKLRSAFTRAYNKAVHKTPFSLQNVSNGSAAKVSAVKVDVEEAMQADDVGEEDEEDDESVAADRMVKQKTKSKTSRKASGSSAKGKGSTSSKKAAKKK